MAVARRENPGRFIEITCDRIRVTPLGRVYAEHRAAGRTAPPDPLRYELAEAIAEAFALEELELRRQIRGPSPDLEIGAARGFRIRVEAI